MLIHHASKQQPATILPKIPQLLETVSATDLRGWVETISLPRHYVAQAENNQWVRSFLADQLRSWGYTVEFQGEFANVVALPPASPEPITLIGAHYDSVPMTDGADDNASAVAALLGCAKALGTLAPSRTGFVLFNREEDGLRGSLDFAERFVIPQGLRIRNAHILEMVGYASDEPGSQSTPAGLPIRIPTTGNFLGLLADGGSAEMQLNILRVARTYMPQFPVLGLHMMLGMDKFFPVLHRSDHAPFWKHGIPAVMWTDTSEFRNPNYHTFNDTPDTLNYEFLKSVTQVLLACTLVCETES